MQTTTMALRPCGSTMQRMRTPCSPTPLFAANRAQPRRSHVKVAAINEIVQIAALDIDWSDPDVQIGVLGGVLGLGLGIGAPIFYSLRDDRDEERLEELRALNRATFKETGEYLTEVLRCGGEGILMVCMDVDGICETHRRKLQRSDHLVGPIAGVLVFMLVWVLVCMLVCMLVYDDMCWMCVWKNNNSVLSINSTLYSSMLLYMSGQHYNNTTNTGSLWMTIKPATSCISHLVVVRW